MQFLNNYKVVLGLTFRNTANTQPERIRLGADRSSYDLLAKSPFTAC